MASIRRIFDLAAAILFEEYGGDSDFDKFSPLLLERLLVEGHDLPKEHFGEAHVTYGQVVAYHVALPITDRQRRYLGTQLLRLLQHLKRLSVVVSTR